MRYIYYCVLAIFCIGHVSACVVEEESVGSVDGQLVHKVFDATFENSDMTTKTVLDETVGENGFRGLLWDSGDEIGVARYEGDYQKFTNVLGEPSADGVFEGYIDQVSQYYAIYPYTDNQRHGTSVSVTIPTVQTYRVNSFDRNMAPMVGKGNDGERLHFMNLCGVLAVQLTGSETIKSIVFQTKNGEKVSGICSVDPDYADYPVLDTSTATETYVTLDCGEGVQLSGEATPFHIVLPPGTYNGFTLYVTTTDGKFMEKTTDRTLTIKRSIVTKAASFAIENNVTEFTNLSEHGHSNCYIVPESGFYSFDANIIGNGEFGRVEGAGFHTSDPSISPVSVELLWEDRPGLIKAYMLDPAIGKVKLMTSGKEGNALIAVKDADRTILWSWHIWMTDQPADQNYANDVLGTFVMLDRNIGAIRADRGTGDEWKESVGLHYQWGRKDPFVKDNYTMESSRISVTDVSKYPTCIITTTPWMLEYEEYFWNPDKKTVYDPCPVGYRIPAEDVWYGFTDNGDSQYVNENHVLSTTWDNGWSFYINSTSETAWYPATGYINGSNWTNQANGYYWSSNKRENTPDHYYSGSPGLYMSFQNNGYLIQNNFTSLSSAHSIRCVQDEKHVDISYPQVKIVGVEDVTSSTAKIVVEVKSEGVGDVTERGIVWGETSTLSDGKVIKCLTAGSGAFSIELTGLNNATNYFVKPYAKNNRGESQNVDVTSFITMNSDNDIYLNSYGTANCYIISPDYASTYCFDCTVKGNSGEKIGEVSSLDVLWEVDGCSETMAQGSIISSVELLNGILAAIKLPETPREGNALIAARDAAGIILWSWHIWVTDIPIEQKYVNSKGIFHVLDRNIGATRPDRGSGDEWKDSRGLAYFWGRKDPFWYGKYIDINNTLTLEFSISNPITRHHVGVWHGGSSSWLGLNCHIPTLWSDNKKTVYDPCPVGYRIADSGVFDGFTTTNSSTMAEEYNTFGPFDYGWYFYINDSKSETAWFPVCYYMCWSDGYVESESEGHIWTSDYTSISQKGSFNYTADYIQHGEATYSDGHGFPVRCMKDE